MSAVAKQPDPTVPQHTFQAAPSPLIRRAKSSVPARHPRDSSGAAPTAEIGRTSKLVGQQVVMRPGATPNQRRIRRRFDPELPTIITTTSASSFCWGTTVIIHPWAVLGAEVGATFEQPLPWNASEVHLWFRNGPAVTCRVARCPGDLLRVEADVLPSVPVGTSVEMQWTQENRGGYAAGAVVAPQGRNTSGLYIRVDESVAGVERRLGVRLPVEVPANVIARSGRVLTGRTSDLSLGGACVVVAPSARDALFHELIAPGDEAPDTTTAVTLSLPTGVISLRCEIVSIEQLAGRVRVRFAPQDILLAEQIGALLRAVQRRLAAQACPMQRDRRQ